MLPKLLVIGHGRHGKDTVCEILEKNYNYSFESSSRFCSKLFIYNDLKEKYGYLYNYYMDFLTENKILILLAKHQKGKSARVYAINEYILRGTIIRFNNSDRTLLKKYKAKVSQIEESKAENSLIDNDIKVKLVNDLFKVQIEFDRSIFYLDSLKDNDVDIYNRNRYSVECVNDKHIFYHFDSYGRMHTNFTIRTEIMIKPFNSKTNTKTFSSWKQSIKLIHISKQFLICSINITITSNLSTIFFIR